MQKELFEWQQLCLENWFKSDCHGIVNAVTGSGKTLFALNAALMLEKKLSENGQTLKIRIIVPKVFLVAQWRREILSQIGVKRENIGCYSGLHKDNPSTKYMIYVLNSARFSLSRHILEDIKSGCNIFLIVDECHHCYGEVNARIFDFVPKLFEDYSRYHSLGLSATSDKIDGDSRFTKALGKVIYRYGLTAAVAQGVISKYILLNVCVNFSLEEQLEYQDLSRQLSKIMLILYRLHPVLNRLKSRDFFARLDRIASEGGNAGNMAKQASFLFFRRKELVYLAQNKIDCVRSIVKNISEDSKIIIFGERIQIAQKLYAMLCDIFPGQIALYHSQMNKESAKNSLLRYQNGEVRILVGCKALDEGLNIPETDVGIVVSSSSSELQRVQRLGRILRKKKTTISAKLYYLYVKDSSDECVFINTTSELDAPIVELAYDEKADSFSSVEFDDLARKVLAHFPLNSSQTTNELIKNLDICRVRCDFLLSLDECTQLLNSAKKQAVRNYFIATLLVIKARLNLI